MLTWISHASYYWVWLRSYDAFATTSLQIKANFFFSMVGIIIGLKHCQLGKEILDKLVLIMKKMILDLDAQMLNLNQLKNT